MIDKEKAEKVAKLRYNVENLRDNAKYYFNQAKEALVCADYNLKEANSLLAAIYEEKAAKTLYETNLYDLRLENLREAAEKQVYTQENIAYDMKMIVSVAKYFERDVNKEEN